MPSPKDTHGPIVKTGPTTGQNRSEIQMGPGGRKEVMQANHIRSLRISK